MTSWRQVEQAAPELAAQVRAAFSTAKHCTMATLRADGAPRISGTEVEFSDDGELRIGSMPGAVKARDLQRWPGEAKVAGRAVEEARQSDGVHVFRLDLTEVVWTGHTDDRSALRVRSWHPGRGVEERVRT